MKPNHSNRLLGQSLLANIFAGVSMVSTSASAADITWDGSDSNVWTNGNNWIGGTVPNSSDNAFINVPSMAFFPVINESLAANEIKIGANGGNTGRLDHHAGSVVTSSWSAVGEFGGNGTYNLADSGGTGGALTGFATGSGSFTAYRLYVSREGTGNMSVNTSGSVKVFNDMYIGEGGSGTLKWDAGTLNRNGDGGWMVIGRDGGGNDGNGTFNISGGTINAANDTIVGLDSGSTGLVNLSGGTYNAGGIWVGRGGGSGTWTVSGAGTQLTSTGEVFIGRESGSNGTFQIDSGTVAVNNWLNVGQQGGTGNLLMSGGALTVQNELRVGNGAGSSGVLSVSDGTISTGSWLSIGRDGATGAMTISGNAVVNQGTTDTGSRLELSSAGGTGTLSLDGGTLTANGFAHSGGTSNIFLNGGQIVAAAANNSFLQNMTSATVEAGGAKIDTNGFNIRINQELLGSVGDGGLVKTGIGTLRLGGVNSYKGTTLVSAGNLRILGDQSAATGAVTVASGATISGIGTVGGATTVLSGGSLAPVGLLTFSSDLSLGAGSIFAWELAANSTSGDRGTDFDAANVGGNLSIDAAAIFRVILDSSFADLADPFWNSNQTFINIFDVTGTTTSGWSGAAVSVFNTNNELQDVSAQGSFTITGTTLTWSAVPEPTSALAGLLLGAGLLRRRRA